MSSIRSCPYCGAVADIEVMAGHTRQECEAKIHARIAHHERCIEVERESLAALHAVVNRDAQVPA